MNFSQASGYDIVIAGHGSRDPEGIHEFERLVQLVQQRASGRRVNHGFLNLPAQPLTRRFAPISLLERAK